MLRWQNFAVAYALLGSLACGLAVAFRDGSPFTHPSPWIALESGTRIFSSLLLGLALSVFLVASTRVAVQKWPWAQKLHGDLRPVARELTVPGIVIIAALSSIGEELFFRGFLAPLVGVIAQAVLFGLAHQVSGSSRWVWITWATIAGLLFGGIFVLTGSLLGPIAAHAIVNGYNLVFLRNHDPRPNRDDWEVSWPPRTCEPGAPSVRDRADAPVNASSEHRDRVNCRHAERCSGCPLIALPYEEQLAQQRGSRSGRLRDLPRARRVGGRGGGPCRNAHRLPGPGQADGLGRSQWRSDAGALCPHHQTGR